MGKSRLVSNIAEHVAAKHGKPVAFFSLEMSETELAHRFIASRGADRERQAAPRQGRDARTGRASCAPATSSSRRRCGSTTPPTSACSTCAPRRGACTPRSADLGIVIVDYLQLMRAEDPRQNRVEQVGQISRGLKILARELDVPVIGISQLSRAPEQRPDKRPILSDLARVGPDRAGLRPRRLHLPRRVLQPRGLRRPGRRRADHRASTATGPTGIVRLAFLEHYPSFANLSRQERPRGAARRRGAADRSDAAEEGEARLSAPSALGRRAAASPRRGDRARAARSAPATASGWILGPGGRRAPVRVPRAARRPRPLARRRVGDPGRSTAAWASTARRSPTSIRRGRAARARVRRRPRGEPRGGPRPVADGRRRDGQDVARDAGLEARARARALGRDLLAAAAAGPDPAHLRRRRRRAVIPRVLRAPDRRSTCCTSTTSAPRSAPTGCCEQLYAIVDERYESERSIVVTTNLDQAGARAADRRADGLAPGRDLRRPRCRCSARTCATASAERRTRRLTAARTPHNPRSCLES